MHDKLLNAFKQGAHIESLVFLREDSSNVHITRDEVTRDLKNLKF